MYRLNPVPRNYPWGSHSFIQKLINLAPGTPLAELWYGAHPLGPATIEGKPLNAIIASDPDAWLGAALNINNGELPYLLKILAADEPLSIQVHPDKSQAASGFARENEAGIPLDAPQRCYKDDNHKPELLLALTPFYMLCGFRAYEDIINSFHALNLEDFFPAFLDFSWKPGTDTFLTLFKELCACSKEIAEKIVHHLGTLTVAPGNSDLARVAWVIRLNRFYPGDRMVIAPLIMNLLDLSALQTVYIKAGTPHAYLEGAGVEIMASSDNVLRAGLTPKHVDVEELCKILDPTPWMPKILSCATDKDTLWQYPVPEKDFSLSYFELATELKIPDTHTPRIILALSDEFSVQDAQSGKLSLKPGQAVIFPAQDENAVLTGTGTGVLIS